MRDCRSRPAASDREEGASRAESHAGRIGEAQSDTRGPVRWLKRWIQVPEEGASRAGPRVRGPRGQDARAPRGASARAPATPPPGSAGFQPAAVPPRAQDSRAGCPRSQGHLSASARDAPPWERGLPARPYPPARRTRGQDARAPSGLNPREQPATPPPGSAASQPAAVPPARLAVSGCPRGAPPREDLGARASSAAVPPRAGLAGRMPALPGAPLRARDTPPWERGLPSPRVPLARDSGQDGDGARGARDGGAWLWAAVAVAAAGSQGRLSASARDTPPWERGLPARGRTPRAQDSRAGCPRSQGGSPARAAARGGRRWSSRGS